MYFALELIGTVAFAISGAMVAIKNKMDILGVIILGVTTAIGGGIFRDIIMGITPPASLTNPLYAIISIVVSIIVFFPYARERIDTDKMTFVIVDAIGLGTFTVIGIEAASGLSNQFLEIFLGVLTGVGGGVLRDIFTASMPIIFVKRFYAVASLCGAILCSLIYPYNQNVAMILGITVIIVLRMLAAKYKWNLPRAK